MPITTFVDGQIIEGTVTGNLRRKLLMDTFFTFADFVVTRVALRPEITDIRTTIFFMDDQSDIVNPPRNSIVRATVDRSNPFSHSPYSTKTDVLALPTSNS